MNETNTTSSVDVLETLKDQWRQFAAVRDWDQFYPPKNLAIALSVEAAKLLEQFQWVSEADSATLSEVTKAKVRKELADVPLYLVRLADRLGVNLGSAAFNKLELNGLNYPVEKSRGNSKKYTEL